MAQVCAVLPQCQVASRLEQHRRKILEEHRGKFLESRGIIKLGTPIPKGFSSKRREILRGLGAGGGSLRF